MCRQITCRRRQLGLHRHSPRSNSANTSPRSLCTRIQAVRRSSKLPGKSRAACQPPPLFCSCVAPSWPTRSPTYLEYACRKRRSSMPLATAQAPAPVTRSARCTGNNRITNRPSAASVAPLNRTAPRNLKSAINSAENALDDTSNALRVRRLPLQQISIQFGIGKLQNGPESRLFLCVCVRVVVIQVTQQQFVKFSHAASALPAQPGFFTHGSS